MPLDSVCLTALKNELEKKIVGLKIDKVQQPERDEIILMLRGAGASEKLLLCAGNGDARVHLTNYSFENPAQPPMFCMLLRKHLTGAKILSIRQPPMERLLDFTLSGYDAMGVECEKHLIVELLGRFANIILTDADGIITDCLRRIDSSVSQLRQVLPGLLYRLPPAQDKMNIADIGYEQAEAKMSEAGREVRIDKWILDTFNGFSPLVCREIVQQAYGRSDVRFFEADSRDDCKSIKNALKRMQELIKRDSFEPYMLSDSEGKPKEFSYMPITQYGNLLKAEKMQDFSVLLSEFYTRRDRAERMRQRSSSLIKSVKNSRDRIARKLAAQQQELKATYGRERLREFGDLITANLHLMKKGQKELKTVDFYSDGAQECTIPLDVLKTPQQNAARYYKEYTKARNAEKFLTEQIEIGTGELEYLDSVLDEISRAEGEKDLAEIRQELADTGYLKQQKSGKKAKRTESAPMQFVSTSGFEIRVGRNNAQNDRLTTKMSMKNDIWLHTQKIHGSHVVISSNGAPVDGNTMLEAAVLAAYYSQARDSRNVPVDYTLVKHVKKPAGSKPGMVIYTDYKTIYVNPDEKLVESLKKGRNSR